MNSISTISPKTARRLAIVGVSARATAQLAVQAGHCVVAIDAFGDIDVAALGDVRRLSHFPRGCVAALRDCGAEAWLYSGGLENHPALVDRIAEIRPLLGNSGRVLRAVRDPWRVAAVLSAAKLCSPELRRDPIGLPTDGSWLVKPLQSGGGRAIHAWQGESRFDGKSAYLQRRITGQSCGVLYVANGRQARRIGVAPHLAPTRGFLYRGSIGPWAVESNAERELSEIGDVLAREFALVGLFGVDIILDRDGRPWTVEVNPRITASAELFARAGIGPLIEWHIAACSTGDLPPDAEGMCQGAAGEGRGLAARLDHPRALYAKEIVYATRSLVVPASFSRFCMPQNESEFWPQIADIPAPGTPISAGDPLVTVFASGDTAAEVESCLAGREREVRIAVGDVE